MLSFFVFMVVTEI